MGPDEIRKFIVIKTERNVSFLSPYVDWMTEIHTKQQRQIS